MKKFLFLCLSALFTALVCVPAIAQEAVNPEGGAVFDFSTFAGITAIVSAIVTQAAKFIKVIEEKNLYKILISTAAGIVLMLAASHFVKADFLAGMPVWQIVLQGLLSGLSACGLFDLFKNLPKPA